MVRNRSGFNDMESSELRKDSPVIPPLSPPEKPDWIRVRLPSGDTWKQVEGVLEKHGLHTVCDEARCPNKGECWGAGTATFMIMGDVCTRACRFCAVTFARRGRPLRREEGAEIALAAETLGLRFVVLTSVDRDDLADRGAGHFAACIAAIRERLPGVPVEALIPDYTAAELAALRDPDALPDVIAHNVETVRSFQWVRDRRASFDGSLATLRAAKALGTRTKTSLLLGLGETAAEVLSTMDELRSAGVDILVMGQYLRPSPRQLPVAEYLHPDRFAALAEEARRRGFAAVTAAPFARTSYHAMEAAAAAAAIPKPAAGFPAASSGDRAASPASPADPADPADPATAAVVPVPAVREPVIPAGEPL
jgi:lipoic acid synthetase